MPEDAGASEVDSGELEARLEQLRARLRERYGWTRIAVELERDPVRRTLIVHGEIAVPQLRAAIVAALEPLLPSGDHLELDLRPLSIRQWRELPTTGLAVWAEHPEAPRRALATELEAMDGPVGVLARAGSATLVRARDGTVGWIEAALGPPSRPRPLAAPRHVEAPGPAICAAARSYLGTPYLLGGATRRRIDCSALVQRAYAAALDLLLPRNSHDQLAIIGASGERGGHTGDLLFIHSRRMQRLHVGVLGEHDTIIHASRSRGAVIEEARTDFELDAEWIRLVTLPGLLDWGHAHAGAAYVELPAR